MKEVIIIGGGFSGVSAALYFKNKIKSGELSLTLIDKNPYHLFHASLYEVATSEEPKKNIVFPLNEILGDKIKFVKGEISNIDTDNHLVQLSNEAKYSYDYLIMGLGSESAFFNIEGLKEYSIPLKELNDGVNIREAIENKYHDKVLKGSKLNIVVGGGGFSGTELTAELVEYKLRLSRHHKKPLDNVNITVIQGSDRLLKELSAKNSSLAEKRLSSFGVNIVLGAHIKKVNKETVETDGGGKYPYDVLIWAGGVKANGLLAKSGFKVNGRGQVAVDENLKVVNSSNIFAVGDIAEFADPITNKPIPGVAQVAQDQGEIAAENVYRSLKENELISYKFRHLGYIIPLKGHFAIADFNKLRITGFFGWVVQQMVILIYLLKIMSVFKALRRWNKFEMYLMRNS